MRKELTILGTWNSSYNDLQNDWKESLKAISEGKITVSDLITHKFSLSKVNDAFNMMNEKSEFFNKVMICPDEEAL